MKKLLKAILVCLVLGAVFFGYRWYKNRPRAPEPTYYRSQTVGRGSVTQEVTATGTIGPIREVSVTTQVTGKIVSLFADYNSRITENQVIALIDPDTYESALASARAQLKSNEATLERTRSQLWLAERELSRQKRLYEREMTTESDLDNAQASYDQLTATVKSNEAAIEQSKASVATAEKNLADCTITSPVTGIVIDRSVEEGQTVVSSMSASGLFTVATELTRVQVEASIPEADIGEIEVGQDVVFTVDAYKKKRFTGKVTQIRLASVTTSNVVTYPVIIEADNPDERLFPSMTANLSVIVREDKDKVILPNAATRFTPAAGEVPPDMAAAESEDESGDWDVVWVADSMTSIHPVRVRLGITDSINTVVEESSEDLVGKQIVVGRQSAAAAQESGTNNPFMPKRPNRRRGGGPPGPPPR